MLYYVNANASRDGNGSKEMPFRHIDDAARIAVAGDEIVVAPGVYREKVTPRHGGAEDARIEIATNLIRRGRDGAEEISDLVGMPLDEVVRLAG
jgi:hypothetical protein